MRTRIYLKAKPTDETVVAPVTLEQDEFGWFYKTDWDLELLELPLAILPTNIRKVTARMEIDLSLTTEIQSCPLRWENAIGVFKR
ncbi:MAG: hypothetical protein HY975_04030, partial [Candidatus Kerfeldbacteria bacterium]|nr:hypothetical protein [Candidatus Kerfeldbacteria bacterium]